MSKSPGSRNRRKESTFAFGWFPSPTITHEGSIVLVGKSYQSVTQTLLNKKPCGGFAIGSSIEEILHLEFHMTNPVFVLCVSFLPPFHFCQRVVYIRQATSIFFTPKTLVMDTIRPKKVQDSLLFQGKLPHK